MFFKGTSVDANNFELQFDFGLKCLILIYKDHLLNQPYNFWFYYVIEEWFRYQKGIRNLIYAEYG